MSDYLKMDGLEPQPKEKDAQLALAENAMGKLRHKFDEMHSTVSSRYVAECIADAQEEYQQAIKEDVWVTG